MEQMITIKEPVSSVTFPGFLIAPTGNATYPALILIHEIWGLNDHIKDVAKRYAKEGYLVFAPDLFAGTPIENCVSPELFAEMRDPAKRDEAQKKMRKALAPMQSPEFAKDMIQKLQACFAYLEEHKNSTKKIGVLGFCFGGTYCYTLATEQPNLQAAVPFYGHAPEPLEKLKTISCPVLAFYGEQDTGLVSALPELKEAMKTYHIDFEAVVYSNCGHAFFNDTNKHMYNKAAATDSWKKSIAFLAQNLT